MKMELDYVKLGNRIRKIRKEKGLTQEVLAEKSIYQLIILVILNELIQWLVYLH